MVALGKAAPVLVLLVLFLALERDSFRTSGEARSYPDTSVYLEVAEQPLLSRAFLTGDKPPAAPLLYKLVHRDSSSIARLQSLLSVAGWFFLAVVVGFELRSADGGL